MSETVDQVAPLAVRRPRFAVLGEFSAGKSTLINLLSNGAALKTQVTATQMAPVWLSHGDAAPYRVDLQGQRHPYVPGEPVDVDRTAYVKMFAKNTILKLCDLIDTPGNSDPNINPIAWERMIEVADAAIWCSPATQAWRQSERASWREVPERFRKHSLLLLTQADKLQSEADREKVLRRVNREARDEFRAIFMLSLVVQNDFEAFLRRMITSVRAIRAEIEANGDGSAGLGRAEITVSAEGDEAALANGRGVVPRRVQTTPATGMARSANASPPRPKVATPEEARITRLRDGLRNTTWDDDAGGKNAAGTRVGRRYGNEG